MKKLIVSFLTVIMTSIAVSAAGYRGFAEINGGILPAPDGDGTYCHLYGSLSTTHGVQLNRHFFVGAGVDVSLTGFRDSDPGVNVFGDVRYDVNIAKTWSPYVNLKIGYGVRSSEGYTTVKYEEYDYYRGEEKADIKPFFINPSIGVRLRLSSKCGLNFGLGYIPMLMGKVRDYYGDIVEGNYTVLQPKGAITLNVGVDF